MLDTVTAGDIDWRTLLSGPLPFQGFPGYIEAGHRPLRHRAVGERGVRSKSAGRHGVRYHIVAAQARTEHKSHASGERVTFFIDDYTHLWYLHVAYSLCATYPLSTATETIA